MTTAEDEFRAAGREDGLEFPGAIEAGRFYRYPGDGKRGGNQAGWCKLFPDGLGGIYGDFSTGLVRSWQVKRSRQLSLVERETFQRDIAESKAEAEAARKESQVEAQQRARAIWDAAKPAPIDHPYLTHKAIKPHGLRVYKGDLQIGGMTCDGALLVPLRDGTELQTLEFIAPDGTKRFLPGGAKRGSYFGIGKPNGVLCLAEGAATAASIYEATGHAVAAAMDAANLEPVARKMRERFSDLRLIICADDDWKTAGNPGITKATEAAAAAGGLVAVPAFGDNRPDAATDFQDLGALIGQDAIKRCVDDAKAPAASAPIQTSPSAPEAVLGGRVWPAPMDEAAFHGLAGEFVTMVEPNTESDSAALLVQALVAFGAFVARGPHYLVEGDEHHCNLFATIVGESSKARKGTSQSRIRRVFERIEGWKPHVSGLSSGEGIKYHVRDPREESKTDKHGVTTLEVVDAGVIDKRLLVVEPEFASVLRATQRQGNTLSATIREAWDSGNLRSLVKNDPVTATGAHVSIVGHITSDELRSELTATDTANGFANRFLFVAAKRSKMLPFGGERTSEADEAEMARRFGEAAELARGRGRVTMTEAARSIWQAVYPALSEGSGGLHGAVTARAEAQVIRLSLVYCLLDCASQIDAPHLLAALAVWQYCDATAKYVFGGSLGDRLADEILRRLRNAGETGLTRTEIRDAFGRHESAERIGIALEMLAGKHLIACEKLMTGGRPTENWRVAK